MLRIPEQPESGRFACFLRSIPLPRGPQWYLVAFRWLIVAASLYTVTVMWNLWQVRSDPNWTAWKFATPANPQVTWNHPPSDAEAAPMLPVWDWMPQVSAGWLLVGSLFLILIRPRTGMVLLGITLIAGVLMDRTRIQPHAMMILLMIGTLPGKNSQLIGRAAIASLWFWVGAHKLIVDFTHPNGMFGFAANIIPDDLARNFPPEQYWWSTQAFGSILGWAAALTETSLGIMCLIPYTRKIVAVLAVLLHLSIIYWNAYAPRNNLIGWNIVLGLAGFALIWPWREGTWATMKQCAVWARVLAVSLFVYPASYYFNGTSAYLSHCIYVPNSPFAILHRPGEPPLFVPFLAYNTVNVPLPPGQSIVEAYFDKIRKPNDVLIIHDPRPWAQSRGLNGRQLTDLGEFLKTGKHWVYTYPDGATSLDGYDDAYGVKQGLWTSWYNNGQQEGRGLYSDGKKQGHWIFYHRNGKKQSEGDFDRDVQVGPWTTWYDDGKKETDGSFADGQMDGVWKEWSEDGKESEMEFRAGLPVAP
jgi:uncharacterized membrane protein YphA (DoxX/SURF4 family)